MFEKLIEAFVILFVVIGPIDNCAAFATLTKSHSPAEKRKMALKSILVASAVMVVFAILGDDLLEKIGISLSSLEISGGILLLLFSIQMVMSKPTKEKADNKSEKAEDISIFPMAMPLIAGPDAIVATVLLVSKAKPDFTLEVGVIILLVVILALTYAAMLGAGYISRLLGKQGIEIVSRLLGILLTAMAIEFIIEGLSKSVLFKGG